MTDTPTRNDANQAETERAFGRIGFRLSVSPSFVALLVMLFAPQSTVRADVVIRKGEARPLVCRVEEQHESGVVVRITEPDGTSRRMTIRSDDLLLIVPAQDPDVLATLEPGRWDDYRMVADEAAARRVDPDAAALAIRLQLIVAFHSEGDVRDGAFAALFDLARNSDEERQLRVLAFRHASRFSADVLQVPRVAAAAPLDENDRAELLRTVRLLRSGKSDAAMAMMRQPQFPEIYSRVSQVLPLQELQRYAYDRVGSNKRTGDLIRLELALLGEPTFDSNRTVSLPVESTPRRHSDAAWRRGLDEPAAPWSDVDWDDVTEFDPRACLFRDGTWRRP